MTIDYYKDCMDRPYMSRLVVEPNLSNEQLMNLYGHIKATTKLSNELLKAKYPELFEICKNYFWLNKNSLLKRSKVASL